MTVQLTPSWQLTTEHAASSYGQPVLLDRGTNTVYGAADICKPYASWGFKPAALHVERMANIKRFDPDSDEGRLIDAFVSLYLSTQTK
jgi:hypothetical protein